MSDKREDDEPAFPVVGHAMGPDNCGMSIRDYFAGQAIAGGNIVANSVANMAAAAYEIADAMLAQRGRK